jgi:hypothetical protein
VTTDAEGNLTIETTNQPQGNGGAGADGGDGAGGPAMQTEPVGESARRNRGFAGQRSRMSWERNPTDGGSITFRPSDNETLCVDGDAVQAVVTADPSPGLPKN